MHRFLPPVWLIAALAATAQCRQPVALIDANKPAGGWEFANGPEFPGARGKLELAAEPLSGRPILSLHGDFTGGGNYVQASIALPAERLEAISFRVNAPVGSKRLPIRLTDATGQVHQINIALHEKGGWQRIVLPVEAFFRQMGTPAALDIVAAYEKWGGANDGKWHQPGRELAILASRAMGGTAGTILLSEVMFHPSTETTAAVMRTLALDEMLQAGQVDWGFNLGQEFPGAKGGLDLVADQPQAGSNAMRLHGDFTGGGRYVGVRKSFSQLNIQAMSALRLKMRSQTTRSYTLRLVDGTGQCHQQKLVPFEADGQWRTVEIAPGSIAGGEHWGGANDGKWHDPVRLIEVVLTSESHEGRKPDLYITGMEADVTVEASVKPPAFAEGFESARPLAETWRIAGEVRVDSPGRSGAGKALVLQRTLEKLPADTWASGGAFEAAPGVWQVHFASKADLHSPDNSYHGSIALEVLDGAGALLETIPLGIGCGKEDWRVSSKTVAFPRGAAKARFRIALEKTYGSFRVDDLSASVLAMQPVEQRIERILLATEAVGNLFLPGQDVAFQVTVEASKPLGEAQQVLRYSVRDYWGAEQFAPGEVSLARGPGEKDRFIYRAEVRIPSQRLAVGKYHELHVAVPQETGEAVREFSGLAVLPAAETRKHDPEQVPFTIRNWDSRIPAYFHLADRIGLRLMGVWGGWSPKAPYKPQAPGIDLCRQLGAKWVTGTPASSVERKGFAEYSEESLRQGMRNFLEKYAGSGLAMIAMGNEPHGKGQKVLENVRAYKAVYEAVKAFDPNIHVIGTSVEPNEEYFRAGYQNYLDSYDFHIYEHYTNVRRTIREYRALMKEYDAVKPIHSTELGLNSQGQTRRAVALEMIKKMTVFFAEGGATVSWFTIQYPDPKGKARGQFGDSHCVFDCKYNLYNPRLDAITYYHMVNGISVKKFVEEAHYPSGAQAYLFRDREGQCLQVLWLDDKREDVFVPLPAGRSVRLVRLDGSDAALYSAAGGISLSLSAEPALLLYQEQREGLAKALSAPAVRLAAAPKAVQPGGTTAFSLSGQGLTADSLRVSCPPLWRTVLRQGEENRVDCTVHAPPSTPAREGRTYVQLLSGGNVTGELTVPVITSSAESKQ